MNKRSLTNFRILTKETRGKFIFSLVSAFLNIREIQTGRRTEDNTRTQTHTHNNTATETVQSKTCESCTHIIHASMIINEWHV